MKMHFRAPKTLLVILVLAVISLVVAFLLHLADQTKTLWDFAQLFIVPVFLAFIAYLFNQSERESERGIAIGRMRDDALQKYLDEITHLVFEVGLLREQETQPGKYDMVRHIARARTLTVLRQLDGERKGLVVRFLYESKLIDKDSTVINMSGADLSTADLSGADLHGNRDRTFLVDLSLSGANLAGANLSNAKLAEAKLTDARLIMADLSNADLSAAHLMRADLRCATMTGANLSGANFFKADLSGAMLAGANLTGAMFTQANLVGAKGLTQNRIESTKSPPDIVLTGGS